MSDALEALLAREANTPFRQRYLLLTETQDRAGRRVSAETEAYADAVNVYQHAEGERLREEQRTRVIINDDDGEKIPDGREFTTTSHRRKLIAREGGAKTARDRTLARKKAFSEQRRAAGLVKEAEDKWLLEVARKYPNIDLPPAKVSSKVNLDWAGLVTQLRAVESAEDDEATAVAGVERQLDAKIKEVTGRGLLRYVPGKVRPVRGAGYRPFSILWSAEPIAALAGRDVTPTVNTGLALLALLERDKILAIAREEIGWHYQTLDRGVLVMTPEAREAELTRLRKELMAAEVALASKVWESAGPDGDVFFDPKWHPAAILGIDLEALRRL